MKNVIITSVLALMLATGANAKNIYVSPDGSTSNNGNSWDSPISDLGTAYSKASKGDVILMAAGTYTVTATINMIEGVHNNNKVKQMISLKILLFMIVKN